MARNSNPVFLSESELQKWQRPLSVEEWKARFYSTSGATHVAWSQAPAKPESSGIQPKEFNPESLRRFSVFVQRASPDKRSQNRANAFQAAVEMLENKELEWFESDVAWSAFLAHFLFSLQPFTDVEKVRLKELIVEKALPSRPYAWGEHLLLLASCKTPLDWSAIRVSAMYAEMLALRPPYLSELLLHAGAYDEAEQAIRTELQDKRMLDGQLQRLHDGLKTGAYDSALVRLPSLRRMRFMHFLNTQIRLLAREREALHKRAC